MKFNKILLFTVSFSLVGLLGCENETSYEFPFQNPDLPLEVRVDDLVGRMTLEEKVLQMVSEAPAIERLGIPEYNWWTISF